MKTEKDQLAFALKAFQELEPTSSIHVITDAYTRILLIVQVYLLTRNDPDANARAWSLVNDDAYKQLSEIQERKRDTLDELKQTMSHVGQLLSVS